MAQAFHAAGGFQRSASTRYGHDLQLQIPLGDRAIGDVLQRTPMGSFRAPGKREREDNASERPPLPSLSFSTQPRAASQAGSATGDAEAASSTMRAGNTDLLEALLPLTQIIAASSEATQPGNVAPMQVRPTTQSRLSDGTGMSPPAKPRRKRIRIKTERRRQQCRKNQARYRDKQRNFQTDLETHVKKLREEIQELQLERYSLCYGERTKLNTWNTVVEYFSLFRYGFLLPFNDEADAQTTAIGDVLRSPDTQRQQAFIRAAMAPDVVCGELQGTAALTEQWRRYSVYFGSFRLRLKSIEKGSHRDMLASAMAGLTITQTTLHYVFPHLVEGWQGRDSTQDAKYTLLAAKLLGRRLECRCSIRFEWDDTSSCVSRMNTKLDLVSPLTRLLGSLQDVALVLEHALISPENAIGDLKDHPTFTASAPDSGEIADSSEVHP